MRTLIITLAIAALLAGAAVAVGGELADRGGCGEFFHDAATGLTWFDPAAFIGAGRGAVSAFVMHNSTGWVWATDEQINALVGSTAPLGYDLEAVLGPAQFYLGNGGPRWIGYYLGLSPDGWLAQSDAEPFTALTQTTGQAGVDAWGPGAWLVNPNDPTTLPRIENRGAANQFFGVAGSPLTWCDPARFQGWEREAVEQWLAAHSDWRWATAAEVASLVGPLAAGDLHLGEILGEPQFWTGDVKPRWIGFYEQSAQPDGLILQGGGSTCDLMIVYFGNQTNAAGWNAGAWVVTESDPTPSATRSWGAVKQDHR